MPSSLTVFLWSDRLAELMLRCLLALVSYHSSVVKVPFLKRAALYHPLFGLSRLSREQTADVRLLRPSACSTSEPSALAAGIAICAGAATTQFLYHFTDLPSMRRDLSAELLYAF